MSLEIRAGVGTDRPNHKQDVGLVQLMLGGHDFVVTADGSFGAQTATALAGFQESRLGFTDGFCDPCDVTYKMLRPEFTDSESILMRATLLSLLGEATFGDVQSEELSPDGLGLIQTLAQDGGIARFYSHPTHGTWEVRGAILARYMELGDAAGSLGMPISGERDHGFSGGRISFFDHGRIVFEPATGVTETILPED